MNKPKMSGFLFHIFGVALIFLANIPVHSQIVKLKSEQGYVQTEDSVQLFYRILGEGKDTIVVVHGGPYNSWYLAADLTPLAAHYTLLFYDLRGAGYSSFISDTSKLGITKHVQDIETLRKHFRLSTLNILAHSTGGTISGFYAVTYPERINKWILTSPAPAAAGWPMTFDNKLDSVSIAIKKQNERLYYSSPVDSMKACWDFYALVARGYFPSPLSMRRMWGNVCNCDQANMLNPNRWYIYQSMGNYDLTARLSKVEAPALIIAGAQDEVPFASFEQWGRSLPNSTLLTFPQSAHLPHVDQPNAFFTAVELFLQNKPVDKVVFQVTGAGIVLDEDDKGTLYQQARASVIRVENELVKRINKENWKDVAAIYAENATVFAPGAPPVYGRQAIAALWHTLSIRGMRTAELQLMDVECSGELLFGKGKYVMKNKLNEMIDVGKFIAIYERTDNQWILHTDIFNSSMETRSPLEVPDYLTLSNKE